MKLRTLSAADIERALPMADCIEATRTAFAAFSAGRAVVPQRLALRVDDTGTLLVKPGYLPDVGLATKLVSFYPGNRAQGRPVTPGIVIHLDPATGEPLAILDGTFLTAWRTGAAGGLATDLLAAPDARVAALFGAGDQADTQAIALDTVRELEEIRVCATTIASAEKFVERLSGRVETAVRAVATPTEAIQDADIVTCVTTAREPVFDGSELGAGVHINAIGGFTPAMREVDVATVERARVFVDSIDAVTVESGELLAAVNAGVTDPEAWIELGSLIETGRPGRRNEEEITLFKSVGLAVQDLVAGAAALERAAEVGLGSEIEL